MTNSIGLAKRIPTIVSLGFQPLPLTPFLPLSGYYRGAIFDFRTWELEISRCFQQPNSRGSVTMHWISNTAHLTIYAANNVAAL